jgi:hypothetical protein
MSAARSSPSFEDMHLVVFGHLLEGVGETVVGELLRDFEEAFVGEVEQVLARSAGLSSEKVATSCSADCACPGSLFAHIAPARERRRSLRERGGAGLGLAEEELTDVPLAETVALDRDVLDHGVPDPSVKYTRRPRACS